jgi:hypothetical protein
MLWFESRATRKQKIAPLIVAFLKSTESSKVLTLHIKNIGEGLAKNVKIKVTKDYARFGRDDMLLSNDGIFKNGFNNFPPQYELTYYIQIIKELKSESGTVSIEMEISYENSENDKFQNTYLLPFNQVLGQGFSDPPDSYIGQISYYLKEIHQTLKAKKD